MFLHADLHMQDEAICDYEYFARSDFSSINCNPNRLVSLCLLADVCSWFHDIPRARTLYRILLQEQDRFAVIGFSTGFFGSVAERLATLASCIGNHEAAEKHFKKAIAYHVQLGARPWIARTQFLYAKMLATQNNQTGESPIELLGNAYTTTKRLGMANLQSRISDLLERIQEERAPNLPQR